MSKTLKILLTVFVIVLVLGGGATYYFAFYSPKSQTSNTEPTKKLAKIINTTGSRRWFEFLTRANALP